MTKDPNRSDEQSLPELTSTPAVVWSTSELGSGATRSRLQDPPRRNQGRSESRAADTSVKSEAADLSLLGKLQATAQEDDQLDDLKITTVRDDQVLPDTALAIRSG